MLREEGQILIEVIIAAAIIIFISVGLVSLISASLRGINQTGDKTVATFLFQESVEALRATAKENWLNVGNLSTSSANQYQTIISGGKWVTASSAESITLNNIVYSRYFWLDDVYRSTSTGNILTSTSGYFDPSTRKATINLAWTPPDLVQQQTFQQSFYVSRFLNEVYTQTAWNGGAVGEQVTIVATTTFATSSGLNYASTVGSIQLLQQ